jgi:CHAT domain-containing protein
MLAAAPGVAPRLSVKTPFRRCVERVPEGGTVVRAECPAPHGTAMVPAALPGLDPRSDDPRSIQTLALLDLVADDPRGIALERSISSLRRAAELADNPAPALVDLSAALIVRAERTQAPRDLLEAYETAQKAADREPRNPAALYNRALALDRFGLVEETAEDWKTAIAADPTSGWADEARRRLRALQAIHAPIPPADNAPLADYARYAAEEPQGARELGMDKLLAEWGEAVQRGDSVRAGDRLRRAEALGTALLRRPGGDASLADMVAAIRGVAVDSVATRRLARAHQEYGAGRRFYTSLDYGRAGAQFTGIIAGSPGSAVLTQWAALYLNITRVELEGGREGEHLLETLATEGAPRYPALLGSAKWAVGLTIGRRDRWESALEEMEASAQHFSRAGENVYAAGATSIVADTRLVLGEADSGYMALHRSLLLIKPYRTSIQLHNVLVSAASAAATDGLRRSAIRLQDEGVAVSSRTNRIVTAAEARLELARQLAGNGEFNRARAQLDTGRILVRQIEEERAREWFEADLSDAAGAVLLREHPEQASYALDSAAAFFTSVSRPLRVLPSLVVAAEARLMAGDAEGAIHRLERAVRLLDKRRDSIKVEPRRAAVFDGARSVVDRIVMLKLAEGRTAEALGYMDRARAALATAGRGSASLVPLQIRAPDGEVALEYARIADTLLVWAVVGQRVHVARIRIDTVALARTVDQLLSDLERRAPEAEVRPALTILYEWLVRPIEPLLGQAGQQVVVVADGEIAAVPFAALYDTRIGRYLIERHSFRSAVSLREAGRTHENSGGDGVLLVADPAFDPRENPLLDRLTHAEAEIRGISPNYSGTIVLEGAEATREAVVSAFGRVAVVHLAVHAVFDDRRPELSHLVLAPTPGRKDGGMVTAAEIARLNLRRVQLVVLSACRTMRGGNKRGGGFTGLSGALLAAGAAGVVGSTWEIDDAFTASLMPEFHRAYQENRDGPLALRAAQLALLRSRDANLKNPAAWAGFRYFGQ